VKKEKKAHVWEGQADEWYVEPAEAVEFLLRRERFHGPVLDPCCGGGTIPKTFRAHGIEAFGTDLRTRRPGAEWFAGELDYMMDYETPLPPHREIVMNPPFFRGKGLEAFIRRALSGHALKVAVFVPSTFLWSAGRATGLFTSDPPARVWPIFPRPSCPPGPYLDAGNKAEGDTKDYAWLVWDAGISRGTTRFVWAPPGRRA